MYILKNVELTIEILDPIADKHREGSRYVTGGYIWQVTDAQHGPLLTGPEYPAEPNTYDGQGMPDMFFTSLGDENVAVGEEIGRIGVGIMRRTSPDEPFMLRDNKEVAALVTWEVEAGSEQVTMRTEHDYRGWSYRLERVVRLNGRTIDSWTSIQNHGQTLLPVRWFAHPFFPHTRDNVLCKFSMPVSMPENPGFFVNETGFITRKADHDWKLGWYQPLEYEKTGSAMRVVQKHDLVGEVITETDFMPTILPIWGNDRTFSFEPYFEMEMEPGEQAKWRISYTF
jgi:hypothetical protein